MTDRNGQYTESERQSPPSDTVKCSPSRTVSDRGLKLLRAPADGAAVAEITTVSDYITKIRKNLSAGTISSWGRYLDAMCDQWGERPLEDILPSDVAALSRYARIHAVRRRHHQGTSASEHAVAAARHVFGSALRDGLVTRNVALAVPKPPRGESERYALSIAQTDELIAIAAAAPGVGRRSVHTPVGALGSERSERMTWMLRWFLETGSRREGLLDLEPGRVRAATRTVMVIEKGRKPRTLPISAELATELADPGSSLYGWSRRRLETDWNYLREVSEWGAELAISSHWLRHSAITRLERASSFTVAAAWAGHSLSSIVTSTYVRVGLPDLVCAWMAMTGLPHPLHDCDPTGRAGGDCFVAHRHPELLATPPAAAPSGTGRLRSLPLSG